MYASPKAASIDPIETGFTIVLYLILSGSVVTNELFVGRTLFPFYVFTLGVGVVCLISGLAILKARKEKTGYPFSVLAVLLPLLVYFLIHYYLHPAPKAVFMIAASLLLVGCTIIFTGHQNLIRKLLQGIVLIALLESTICLLQWAGIVPSFNSLFKITGTYLNPNVTAMFIAMAFPACVMNRNSKYAIGGSALLIEN